MASEKLNTALWWLRRGFYLIPVQPDTKHTMTGFGVHQKTIKTSVEAELWFDGKRGINLAVVAHPGIILLDFDDPAVYQEWATFHANESRTYTERTPRGGYHVALFATAPVPSGMVLRQGVEHKDVFLVYPSIVGGKPYERGQGEIFEADPVRVFSGLTAPDTRTPQVLENIERITRPRSNSILSRIKDQVELIALLQEERPGWPLKGSHNAIWMTGCCPFHDDHRPSFWINTRRKIWGCHACGLHGDVINLYAQLHNVTNNQALEVLRERVTA